MEEVIAGLQGFTFAFELDVESQKGTGLLPFQGMDKSSSAVCNFFAKGLCVKGMLCPLRHEQGEKLVVCKHWLRGLCRKSDCCDFLHQYDVSKMPVCYFHSKFGNCSNKECLFLHLKPVLKLQDCPWYNQGFCKEVGPLCKYRHVHQVLCPNYFTGFCPEGPQCQFGHCSLSTSHGIQQLLLATLWCPLSRQSPWSTVRGGGVCLRPAAQGHTLHLRPPCQQSKLYPLEPSKPSLKRGSWTFS
ncbi:putative cleavage and polyadenylation specificity factor subunit 4-like protein isoform X8 [Mus musculus]|uniref:putative cleavage and polyadenylation specificity factor subunit 4-like protein isoform X8 n=1 Tax=Mus musculus TaxID=10090 RepID=UPI0003D74866|nr:putative cleavage and polyadenylation specificity factor subunit 4-like protein isoform X8 [Mus musculus]|eukprot:XP_006533767.1 PREDICTED: putative cleavage and polyadenylation specificity factor subunit 4-like protein isoform X7 [Mus musculus]